MSGFAMRRLIASSLLLLMVAAFLVPAALAGHTAPLPACCRASGPHHCSAPASDGVQVRGQACPYRKPLIFSTSAAPRPTAQPVTPSEAHPFLHEFYPELFVSQEQQHDSVRAPPEASLK